MGDPNVRNTFAVFMPRHRQSNPTEKLTAVCSAGFCHFNSLSDVIFANYCTFMAVTSLLRWKIHLFSRRCLFHASLRRQRNRRVVKTNPS
jgi:hypothetical protein